MSSGGDRTPEEREELRRGQREEQRAAAVAKLRQSGNAWSLELLHRPGPPTQAEWTLHQHLHAALLVLG